MIALSWAIFGQAWKADFVGIYSDRAIWGHLCAGFVGPSLCRQDENARRRRVRNGAMVTNDGYCLMFRQIDLVSIPIIPRMGSIEIILHILVPATNSCYNLRSFSLYFLNLWSFLSFIYKGLANLRLSFTLPSVCLSE